ncbi:MAG: epoxyqueuosine reductase QueH [Lachnospiraceae bacterium]|nr:epoxyqueuosine reductase QueH [Lachnospiraceae bacterium]
MRSLNYKQQLERELKHITSERVVPTLFLHACCAPCSSYVLEYLSVFFEITVYYYNPNISPVFEYKKRVSEIKGFIERVYPEGVKDFIEGDEIKLYHPVHLIEGDYDPADFDEIARGLEKEPEKGARCYKCYELRLKKTALKAKELGFDYFCSTLSISPYKNADWLNEIGSRLGNEIGIAYLVNDFKKNNGYRRSCELSEEYGLYRQNYCGCIYSKRD